MKMTDTTADLIGPLTAAEWCSLRLTEGNDDPLYCCAASSEFRSALFEVLRMGADADLRYYFVDAWQQAVAYGHGEGNPLLDRIRDFYRLDDDSPEFTPEEVRCAPHCNTPCHTALREVEQERDHWKQMYELSQPGRVFAPTSGSEAGA
jgi:hypothetical protein